MSWWAASRVQEWAARSELLPCLREPWGSPSPSGRARRIGSTNCPSAALRSAWIPSWRALRSLLHLPSSSGSVDFDPLGERAWVPVRRHIPLSDFRIPASAERLRIVLLVEWAGEIYHVRRQPPRELCRLLTCRDIPLLPRTKEQRQSLARSFSENGQLSHAATSGSTGFSGVSSSRARFWPTWAAGEDGPSMVGADATYSANERRRP